MGDEGSFCPLPIAAVNNFGVTTRSRNSELGIDLQIRFCQKVLD